MPEAVPASVPFVPVRVVATVNAVPRIEDRKRNAVQKQAKHRAKTGERDECSRQERVGCCHSQDSACKRQTGDGCGQSAALAGVLSWVRWGVGDSHTNFT